MKNIVSIFANNRREKQVGKTSSHRIMKVETFSDSGKLLKIEYQVQDTRNPFFINSVNYRTSKLADARRWAKLHHSY